jgi:hypothetical protein
MADDVFQFSIDKESAVANGSAYGAIKLLFLLNRGQGTVDDFESNGHRGFDVVLLPQGQHIGRFPIGLPATKRDELESGFFFLPDPALVLSEAGAAAQNLNGYRHGAPS